MINENPALHSYFGDAVIQPSIPVTINTRINGDGFYQFCETKDVLVFPRRIIDVHGEERIIVNVRNYSQAIKFQTCR